MCYYAKRADRLVLVTIHPACLWSIPEVLTATILHVFSSPTTKGATLSLSHQYYELLMLHRPKPYGQGGKSLLIIGWLPLSPPPVKLNFISKRAVTPKTTIGAFVTSIVILSYLLKPLRWISQRFFPITGLLLRSYVHQAFPRQVSLFMEPCCQRDKCVSDSLRPRSIRLVRI